MKKPASFRDAGFFVFRQVHAMARQVERQSAPSESLIARASKSRYSF
jgi:hypothetical protein